MEEGQRAQLLTEAAGEVNLTLPLSVAADSPGEVTQLTLSPGDHQLAW